MAPPAADVLIVFRAVAKTKQEAVETEEQYLRLLDVLLNRGGLKAVGKRKSATGDGSQQALVFISAPEEKLVQLVQKERYTDFLNGIPSSSLPSVVRDFNVEPLSPADRIRMAYNYVTGSALDGSLGVAPGVPEWSRVESVMALHDTEFNAAWLKSWTSKKLGLTIGDEELRAIKDQFGESIALYFAFVSFYTKSLLFPSAVGIGFYLLSSPYNPIYSFLLCIWSITFVEGWRLRQKALSVHWGTHGYARVETRRAQFIGKGDSDDEHDDSAFPWWKREGRVVASLPVIAIFAILLTSLVSSIFVVEAFATQLYQGPGVKYVGLVPTALFVTLVPRLVGFYQAYAQSLTSWENHIHSSDHERSLTLKTFAISTIVAYGGLYLSAFVYVPFGQNIMDWVQSALFSSRFYMETVGGAPDKQPKPNLNPDRLRTQVFTYLVTNQVINTFTEVGLPFVMNRAEGLKGGAGGKKKVEFENDGSKFETAYSTEEKTFLKAAREQVGLPDYALFGDYSEMVTQFGYCVIWSSCWTLAPVMALINNWLELRSDAFKIAHHARRPIPARTDSIGPWLDALSFLTWQGALTNAALVSLFRESSHNPAAFSHSVASGVTSTLQSAIFPALLIALSTSHAYILFRALIKHVAVRTLWRGTEEDLKLKRSEKEIKKQWLSQIGDVDGEGIARAAQAPVSSKDATHKGAPRISATFWEDDEALALIKSNLKVQ